MLGSWGALLVFEGPISIHSISNSALFGVSRWDNSPLNDIRRARCRHMAAAAVTAPRRLLYVVSLGAAPRSASNIRQHVTDDASATSRK